MLKIYLKIILFICVLSALLGIVDLEPWKQIEYIRGIDSIFLNLNLGILTHLPRYLLIYPCYFISEITNIELNKIYTLYVLFAYYLSASVWMRICFSNKTPIIESILKCSIPLILFFITNGRFSFILLGLTLLLDNALKEESQSSKNYFSTILGLFLINVSSGAAMNGFLFISIIYFRKYIKQINLFLYTFFTGKIKLKNTLKIFSIVLIVLFIFTFIFLYVNKNMSYFGGFNISGFFGILSHGFGFIFSPEILREECNDPNSLTCSIASNLTENKSLQINLTLIYVLSTYIFYKLIFKNRRLSYVIKIGFFTTLLSGTFGITAMFSGLFLIPAIPLRTLHLKVNF